MDQELKNQYPLTSATQLHISETLPHEAKFVAILPLVRHDWLK